MKVQIINGITGILLMASCATVPVSVAELQDGDLTTTYRGTKGENKICLEWPENISVKNYKIYASGDSCLYDPAQWILEGSVDGKQWKELDRRSGEKFSGRYQCNTYAIAETGDYRFYRLIAESGSGDSLKIAEMELKEEDHVGRWKNFNYPEINFVDQSPETEGSRFYRILVQDPSEYIRAQALKVADILYFSAKDSMPDVRQIDYTLKSFDGISYKGGEPPVVHIVFSTNHVEKSFSESLYKLGYETVGVLSHELTHAYQLEPQGCGSYGTNKTFWACIEGVADAVRTQAGYFDVKALRKPGGNWMDGYKTTGFFIQWLTTKDPDAIRKFNRTCRELPVWSFDGAIKSIFGEEHSIEEMWQEYQDSLVKEQEAKQKTEA